MEENVVFKRTLKLEKRASAEKLTTILEVTPSIEIKHSRSIEPLQVPRIEVIATSPNFNYVGHLSLTIGRKDQSVSVGIYCYTQETEGGTKRTTDYHSVHSLTEDYKKLVNKVMTHISEKGNNALLDLCDMTEPD